MNVDDEWNTFLCNQGNIKKPETKKILSENLPVSFEQDPVPECEELYISTQTKVLFLNQPVDINTIFWKIIVIPYWKPSEGVVKKQMKIVSKTPEEFQEYRSKLQDIPYYTENIINFLTLQIFEQGPHNEQKKKIDVFWALFARKQIKICR